ncbi:MAG: Bcr/CflA family drug resistance efflux transporter, partial [Propionivibrio sp.]
MRTILLAYKVMAAAALLNLALNFFLPPGVPWSILPIPLYTFGMSLAMPCLTLLALDAFPLQRGLASSCQMFLQSAMNSVVAGLLAPALWDSTLTLAFGMTGLLLLGGWSSWQHHRRVQGQSA